MTMSTDVSDYTNERVDEELTKLFVDRAQVPEPWGLYGWLRENAPIREWRGITLVTRYAHVNALFRDPRISRQEAAIREIEANRPDDVVAGSLLEEANRARASMLINQDDPGHRRVRKLLDKAFRPKAVAEWLPTVQAVTDELITRVEGRSEFDLLEELAYPLPEAVICDLMGVPREDHALWTSWIDAAVASSRTSEPTPEKQQQVTEALVGFLQYFRTLVARRRDDLGDDLVSHMIRLEAEGDQLSELELMGTLQMLIVAGSETTSNLIGNSMLALLRAPDQYELLRRDPLLMPGAVEEFLRTASASDWALPRVATDDIELDGSVIRKGSLVVFSIGSANRDPEIFQDPERLDIQRMNNRHIGFAAGPHFCLGALLARREGTAMLEAIMTRLPELELAEEPEYKSTFVRALKSLQVRVKK